MFCTHLRKFNIAECGVYLKKAEGQAEGQAGRREVLHKIVFKHSHALKINNYLCLY